MARKYILGAEVNTRYKSLTSCQFLQRFKEFCCYVYQRQLMLNSILNSEILVLKEYSCAKVCADKNLLLR
jgi:hypothetical protein